MELNNLIAVKLYPNFRRAIFRKSQLNKLTYFSISHPRRYKQPYQLRSYR